MTEFEYPAPVEGHKIEVEVDWDLVRVKLPDLERKISFRVSGKKEGGGLDAFLLSERTEADALDLLELTVAPPIDTSPREKKPAYDNQSKTKVIDIEKVAELFDASVEQFLQAKAVALKAFVDFHQKQNRSRED